MMCDMNKGECPNCGEMNLYTNPLCNKCGAQLPWADAVQPIQTNTAPVKKKKSSLGETIRSGLILFIVLSFIAFFIAISSEQAKVGQNDRNMATLNSEASERSMRESFDNIEETIENNSCLRDRVRALRLEWIEGKSDSQKLETVIEKLDLLTKDIENGSC